MALAAERNVQNGKEDIYDGIFQDVTIAQLHPEMETETVLFRSKHTGLQEWAHRAELFFGKVMDWAIETFWEHSIGKEETA